MAEIGALVANLELQTASFRKDMDKAVAALNSNAAKMNQAFAGIERRARQMNVVVGGFIASWVGGKAVAAINNALALADNIGKQARNAGLSARAYQELAFAQEQSGGRAEVFNKSILFFNRVIGEAANGSRQAVEALKLVGITVDDLKSQSVEQLYVRATTTLATYTDSTRRAAAIQKLFSEEALKTATAFTVNAGELDRLRAAAHSAGVVLDESTIANAERAKDEMEKLSKVISIQLTEAFVQWAPLLVKATKFIADLGEMAGWAARRLGILNAASAEQEYEDLLKRHVDLMDTIAFFRERTDRGEIVAGGDLIRLQQANAELAQVRDRLAELRQMMARNKGLGADGKPRPTDMPAVVGDIKPVAGGGAPTGEMFGPDIAKEQQRYLEFLAEKEAREEEASVAHRIRVRADFDALRATFEEEFAARQEKHLRISQLDEYYRQLGLEQDALYHATREQIELEHQARLGDIMAQAKLEGLRFERMTLQQKLQTVASFGQSELAAVANTNKTLFNLQKGFSLAQLAIEMPTAIGAAIERGGGLPWGAVFGAITAAKYVGLIAQVKGAKFGTSSSPASVAGGGATPVQPVGGLGAEPVAVPELDRGRAPILIQWQINTRSRLVPIEELDEMIREFQERLEDGAGRDFG